MIVIPAEAGIQKIRNWIPIFMGMTEISAGDIRGSACADRATPERFAQASPPGRKKYPS